MDRLRHERNSGSDILVNLNYMNYLNSGIPSCNGPVLKLME